MINLEKKTLEIFFPKDTFEWFDVTESSVVGDDVLITLHGSTNASAESFNAKLKSSQSVFRGVRDRAFHLFRVAKLYALPWHYSV